MTVGRWYEELRRLDALNSQPNSGYRHDGVTGREIMLTRHGHHITAVTFSDLTAVTEIKLDDGSTDSVYIAHDQLPSMRGAGDDQDGTLPP